MTINAFGLICEVEMRTLKRILVIPVGALLLAGCAQDFFNDLEDVDDARNLQPTDGSAFTRALSREYADYAIHELEKENDWYQAANFARKAKAAARGLEVLPEKIDDWYVGEEERHDVLAAARKRLMTTLDGGAREREPVAAARAQAMFDCWIEREDDDNVNTPYRAGKRCTDIFLRAMSLLEGKTNVVK